MTGRPRDERWIGRDANNGEAAGALNDEPSAV
jgi:hypothetical protein